MLSAPDAPGPARGEKCFELPYIVSALAVRTLSARRADEQSEAPGVRTQCGQMGLQTRRAPSPGTATVDTPRRAPARLRLAAGGVLIAAVGVWRLASRPCPAALPRAACLSALPAFPTARAPPVLPLSFSQ